MTGSSKGFTFDNYIEVLTPYSKYGGGLNTMFDKVMRTALPNTLLITIITVPASIILSLIIAIALNSIKVFKKVFQTIFFMPYVTNAIAIGMVFTVIFDTDYGIWNSMFGLGQTAWLFPSPNVQGQMVNYWNALFAICFYIVWHSLPYKILIFLGGLQNIDAQYYDAAKIDGASKGKTILKVTVPLLSPQILYIMITSFIGAFKEYNSVIGLFGSGGGRVDRKSGFGARSMKTVVFFIYEQLESANKNLSIASAVAVMLFLIILAFTGLQFLVSKRRVHY